MLRKSAAAALVLMLFAPLAGDALHAADAGAILSKIAGDAQAATQAIEDAKGSMNAFYAALSRTAAGQPGAVTRIAHYGDSLIEMDLLSGEARRRLQSAFGDAGHGFIHVAKTRTWYHHDDVEHDPEAKWIAFQLKERGFPLNRFGLGGAVSVPYKAGAESEIGTVRRGDVGKSVSRFEILALRSPDGGGRRGARRQGTRLVHDEGRRGRRRRGRRKNERRRTRAHADGERYGREIIRRRDGKRRAGRGVRRARRQRHRGERAAAFG
ncbi:MAG: hypothetical protein M5R36_09430 [Deltaproteobacteria bacterium]|nr:hypothetical protein [Deltaproteobacteria bacterium]